MIRFFEPGWATLLQAGIAVDVRPSIERFYPPFWVPPRLRWRAWTEWWSEEFAGTDAAAAVEVSNFPVRPGDTMSFLVYAEQPDFGYAWISNFSTGQSTSVSIPAQPQIASLGTTMEWIVESVGGRDLPRFSPVTFNSCVGGSFGSHLKDVEQGFVVDIDGSNGKLTSSSTPSDASVMVEWVDWS